MAISCGASDLCMAEFRFDSKIREHFLRVSRSPSTRTFDQFGDWHFLGMLLKAPWYLLHRHAGDAFAERYWYRAERR
jgi:hypothetical protein